MSKFTIQLDKWAGRASVDIKTLTKLVAFRIHDRIVELTPVDTGRARASWNLIVGESPDTSVAPPEFSGGGVAGAAAAKAKIGNVALANSYVISNNLPYIERLENGWSKQAPAGCAMLGFMDVKTRLDAELL